MGVYMNSETTWSIETFQTRWADMFLSIRGSFWTDSAFVLTHSSIVCRGYFGVSGTSTSGGAGCRAC